MQTNTRTATPDESSRFVPKNVVSRIATSEEIQKFQPLRTSVPEYAPQTPFQQRVREEKVVRPTPEPPAFKAPTPGKVYPIPKYPPSPDEIAGAQMAVERAKALPRERAAIEKAEQLKQSPFTRALYGAAVGTATGIPILGQPIKRAMDKGLLMHPQTKEGRIAGAGGNVLGFYSGAALYGPAFPLILLAEAYIFTPGTKWERLKETFKTATILSLFMVGGATAYVAKAKYGTTAMKRALIDTTEGMGVGLGDLGLQLGAGVDPVEAGVHALAFGSFSRARQRFFKRSFKGILDENSMEWIKAEARKKIGEEIMRPEKYREPSEAEPPKILTPFEATIPLKEQKAIRQKVKGALGISKLDYSEAKTLWTSTRKTADSLEVPYLYEKGDQQVRLIPGFKWRKVKGEPTLAQDSAKMAIVRRVGTTTEYKNRKIEKWGEETSKLRRDGFENIDHKRAIEEALRTKKSVSLEVMAEHYDLVERYATDAQKQQLADRAEAAHEESFRAERERHKIKLPKIWSETRRALWDVSGNIKAILRKDKDLGLEAVIHHDLARGAQPYAMEKYNAVAQDIARELTSREDRMLAEAIYDTRLATIQSRNFEYKTYDNLQEAHFREHLKRYVPEASRDKITRAKAKYFTAMDEALQELRNAGLIDEQQYLNLRATAPYAPMQYMHRLDPVETYMVRGKKHSVSSSGLDPLQVGSEKIFRTNWRAGLMQVLTRTYSRIARNNANVALYEFAKQNPKNGFVRIAPFEITRTGKPKFFKAPADETVLSVMIDGKPHRMWMKGDMAREWLEFAPKDPTLSAVLRWASFSPILRAGATGYNPFFITTNVPRDVAYTLFTTRHYSSNLPIGLAQIQADIAAVAADAFGRKGLYESYAKYGGLMNFLTQQGAITKHYTAKSVPGQIGAEIAKAVAWPGETSEILVRLAIMRRVILNETRRFKKGTRREPNAKEIETIERHAVHAARTYLDFAQGGWLTKFIDSGAPYLNAGVQAMRGLGRAFRERPLTTGYKSLQVMGLGATTEFLNILFNPEAYKDVSTHDLVNYMNITTPLEDKDERGNKVFWYGRIALSPESKPFYFIGRMIARKTLGMEVDTADIKKVVEGSFAITPEQFWPPSAKAWIAYALNKDMWSGYDVHPQAGKIEPGVEYRPGRDHPLFGKAGQIFNFSGPRAEQAFNQVFPMGNPIVSGMSFGIRSLMDGLPEEVKEDYMKEALRSRWVGRVLKRTRAGTAGVAEIRKKEKAELTRQTQIRRPVDILLREYGKAPSPEILQELMIYRNELKDKGEETRDYKRIDTHLKKELRRLSVPPRVLSTREWDVLAGVSLETRAQTLREHLDREPDSKVRAEIMLMGMLRGVITPDVIKELAKIQRPQATRSRIATPEEASKFKER